MSLRRDPSTGKWLLRFRQAGRGSRARSVTLDASLTHEEAKAEERRILGGEKLATEIDPGLTLGEVWARYEAVKLPNLSPKSQDVYRYAWGKLEPFFKARKVASLRPEDFDTFCAVRKSAKKATGKGGYSSASRRMEVYFALLLLRWAEEKGMIEKLPFPCRAVDKPEAVIRDRFLTPEETRILFATAADFGPLDEAFARFLGLTGARLSEATFTTVADVDYGAKTVRLPPLKGGPGRTIRLVDDLAVALKAIPRPTVRSIAGDRLFVHENGRPWTSSGLRKRFADVVKASGLKGKITAHTLRHSFAAVMIRSGARMESVASLLGHRSTSMVWRVYGHLSPSVFSADVDRLADTLREPGVRTVCG